MSLREEGSFSRPITSIVNLVLWTLPLFLLLAKRPQIAFLVRTEILSLLFTSTSVGNEGFHYELRKMGIVIGVLEVRLRIQRNRLLHAHKCLVALILLLCGGWRGLSMWHAICVSIN